MLFKLGSDHENMFCDTGIFRFCEIYWEYRTAGHLVFWKPWPAVELEKVLSVTKHGFVFWVQRKPNTRLEIYKAFHDGCLENEDLENDYLENDDLENEDLENDDLENDDLENDDGDVVAQRIKRLVGYRRREIWGR